jgi:hypothetical protein
MTKKVLPPIVAALLLLVGITMIAKPGFISFGSTSIIEKAVIIRETQTDKPLSEEWVELFVSAEKLGISVWDREVLGKGKKPSAEAQPFLDAAGDKELPILALKFANGKITTRPCPSKLDALKKAVGKP